MNTSLLNQRVNINSNKYKLLTTQEVVQPFLEQGYRIAQFSARKTKKIEKRDHAYHVLRLRHDALKIGDDFIDILISNSYDGTSSFKINIGIFRLVCSNGLVLGSAFFERRVKHIGEDFYSNVRQAISDAVNQKDRVMALVTKLKSIQLNNAQLEEFKNSAIEKRVENIPNLVDVNLNVEATRKTSRLKSISNQVELNQFMFDKMLQLVA